MITILLSFLVATLVVFHQWTRRRYEYWKSKGIEGPKPKMLVGNLSGFITGKHSLGEIMANIYNETKHLPYSGGYLMMKPCWIVNDPEIIKRVLVKDFAHFTDHGHDFNYKVDPLFENLFFIRGERWKSLRAKLTPMFTSSRMKQMFGILESCSKIMLQSLEDHTEVVLDVKELLGKFTTDVIGSCAFGIECNSFKYTDAEFRMYGKKIIQVPPHRAILRILLFYFSSKFLRKIPMSTLGKKINDFFISSTKQTIEYREKNNLVKNDALQLLIQLMKRNEIDGDDEKSNESQENDSRLSIEQVAAQAFVFFFAGFESSSSTASLALLELAKNPDVQKTLLKEIDNVLERYEGNLTYNSTSDMPYLTMVIEETLRKYPATPVLSRICTKDYTIPNTNIVIEKDTSVMIPLNAIHRDERYFPDPEKFDPDRFSSGSKESRNQFSYMPFGEGPRICIGSRFGMMQTRLGLASLLSRYEVSMCDKTIFPPLFKKKTLSSIVDGPIYVKMSKRIK